MKKKWITCLLDYSMKTSLLTFFFSLFIGNLTIQASWLKPTSKVPASERLETFTLHSGEEVNFPSSGFLELSVSDSGPGLTEDQMAELFHDGVQFNVNNLQVGQGSGLGLFITKGIVERHGGRLSVASEGLGKGSTFTMTLPLHHHRLDHFASSSSLEAPEREVHSPQTDPAEKHGLVTPIPMELPFYHQPETASLNQSTRATAPATTVSHLVSEKEKRDDSQVHQQAEKKCMAEQPAEKRSHHILVVDDCAVNRRLLTRLLTRAGHACDEAQDGQVAVDQVGAAMEKGSLYDTILLDYEMPVMNGPTAAAEMRKVGCDSLIVGVTGNLMRDDIEYFKGMGANEVLPKPFKMKDLNQFWAEHNFG
jgi:CheY-like chemotaxis protein